jgi:hypothetical protein
MAKYVLWALLAVALVMPGSVTADDTQPNIVRVRDYTVADCIADDTEGIEQAIYDWQDLTMSRTAGVLDFGTGCYRTTDTLHFGRPDELFQFGTIRGDSPVLTQIRPDAGVAVAADMKRLKYSTVSGLGFYGRGSGTGLLLSNTVPGMGTNNIDLSQLMFQMFGVCLQIGEASGAAAAELTFTQLQVQSCGTGIYAIAQNTLDLTFINLTLASNTYGFYSPQAHQINFVGGGGQGNRNTFTFLPGGNFSVSGWREEAPSGIWLKAGCCNAGTFVTVADTMVYGNSVTPVIQSTGDLYLTVTSSFIGGRIAANPAAGSTIITNSAIYDSAPWVATANAPNGSGMYYRSEGNYKPAGPANPAEASPKVTFTNQSGRAVNGLP